ncbi:hypothetical protein AAFC00_004394 [Neodothiora populina]|uniref:Helicase ATP-binding domain-containing protein n=1 Tax=Neodothiora populina TaxID=2781224 RepID=A0ABR3PJJ6_9PEZI
MVSSVRLLSSSVLSCRLSRAMTLLRRRSLVPAIILAPSREPVQQIQKVVITIGDFTNIKCYACFGGTPARDDIKALQDRPQLVVGTPGRVYDMIQRRVLRIDSIKMFVLDEADEMLSRGLTKHVYDIFELLPQSTQVVFLSAIMPQDVLDVTTKFMRDPIRILVKKRLYA